MVELYKKQVRQFNAPIVNKPVNKDNAISNTASKIAQYYNKEASYYDKKAGENFILGTNQITEDVITNAYTLNPTNPKKFLDDVKTNAIKSMNSLGVPSEWQDKILQNIDRKSKGYISKINTNVENKIDNENKNLVINSYNDAISKQNSFYSNMIGAIVQNNDRAYEGFKQAYNINKLQSESLANNAFDKNGNHIINKTAVKETALDKVNVIKDNLYDLDYESLKKFDESFKDRKRFTKQADISNDEYNDIENFIKRRRKEFSKDDERQIESQNYYNTLVMAKSFDTARANQMVKDGIITKTVANTFKKFAEKEYNETLITDEDDNFVSQVSLLNELTKLKNDGSKDYNKKYMDKAARALQDITVYINNHGTTSDIDSIISDTFVNVTTNQEYADMLESIYDSNTPLGKIMDSRKDDVIQTFNKGAEDFNKAITLKDKATNLLGSGLANMGSIISNLYGAGMDKLRNKRAKETGLKEANAGIKSLLSIAINAIKPGISEEEKQLTQEVFTKELDKTNKNIIKAKYTGVFGNQLDKAEKLYNEGKKAYITHNGVVYEFKGYSNNDILIERAK